MPDWLFGVLAIVVVLALFLGARWVLSLAGDEAAVPIRGTALESEAQATRSPGTRGISDRPLLPLTVMPVRGCKHRSRAFRPN